MAEGFQTLGYESEQGGGAWGGAGGVSIPQRPVAWPSRLPTGEAWAGSHL